MSERGDKTPGAGWGWQGGGKIAWREKVSRVTGSIREKYFLFSYKVFFHFIPSPIPN